MPRHFGSRGHATQSHLHRSCTVDFHRYFYLFFNKFQLIGAPGEIRTPDLLVRSQALYPTELRAQSKNLTPLTPKSVLNDRPLGRQGREY